VETTLSWRSIGTGEPLLLIHGLGTSSDDWAVLAPRLARTYRVLSVDLPGHGRSPALSGHPSVPAIADVLESDLDALGLSRVHLLGNSLGARLALELAGRQRALSAVALAPSGMGLPHERTYQTLLMGGARVVLRTLHPLIEPLSHSRPGRALLLSGFRARPTRASAPEARALQAGFAEAVGFWRMLLWSVVLDVPTGLDRVDCPVILAQGTRDLLSGGQTPRFLMNVPGSRFQPLLRSGHSPQSDSPDELVRLVHESTRRSETRREAGQR
jgi:pimeloyl-ACP methyl ester carboxylesterase